MPRRGEYRHDFPTPQPDRREPSRIGVRQVVTPDSRDRKVRLTVDPSVFACSVLAGELADGWVELVAAADLEVGAARQLRRSIRRFCAFVDREVPRPQIATLARAVPDLHAAVTDWVRGLPVSYRAGSRQPAVHAGGLRRLIGRRIEHPDRRVVGPLHGWVNGAVGLRRGETDELDEFSRTNKLALVKAAWADMLAVEARIRAGWALAASGADPAAGSGWVEPANILWAIAEDAYPAEEIYRRLPRPADWPPALHAFLPATAAGKPNRKVLLAGLVRQLFLHNHDLQGFRILLMAATGHASEEVTSLDESDIEFGPRRVMVDFTKNRAHAEPRRSFGTDPGLSQASLRPSRPQLDPGDLLGRLLRLSRPLAERAGLDPVPLFLRAAVHHRGEMTIAPFNGALAGSNLQAWLERHEVTVDGPADIRRLRKSSKVEKVVVFKGRISDIADDHSEETFRGHYAHGTTLRVIAGDVITAAQRRWFEKALEGPVVLAEETLDDPDAAAVLGMSPQEIDDLRSGQLDMGVSGCKDPRRSPYGRPGQICPVAPLRCFECRNALILPSNLPQMLLFAEHLERLRNRLPPRHFDAFWKQSRVNLLAALDARTDAEIARARQQIAEDGLTLHLPLSAHVEFDD